MSQKSKRCFVISPIGEEESKIRKDADLVLKHIIRPPVEGAGFTIIRADQIEKTGLITNQIIEHVIESELVVADLSGKNPNVFYELALRHAVRKPLIQLIRRGEELPFDVAAMRTIPYDTDVETADKAKQSISSFLNSSESDPAETESPISAAIDLYSSKDVKSSTSNQLARIRNDVGRILVDLQNVGATTLYDADDIMQELAKMNASIGNSVGEKANFNNRLLGFFADQKGKSGAYPQYMIVTRTACALEDDFPHLANKLKSTINLDNGDVDELALLLVQEEIASTAQNLTARGFGPEGRLLRTIGLVEQVLNIMTDDSIYPD